MHQQSFFKPNSKKLVKREKMKDSIRWVGAVMVSVSLAACGGGGGGGASLYDPSKDPTNPTNGADPTASVSNVVLQLDRATVGNSGSDQVKVTVTTTNANNNVVSGAKVSVSADANTVVIADSEKTGATGKLTASVLVGDENRSNRTVTVTVKVGNLTRTAQFAVQGAKLKSTLVPNVIEPGGNGSIIYVLTDVNGNNMGGQDISVSGAGLSGAGKTDGNGTYTFNYVAPAATGDIAVTASAGGTSVANTISVIQTGSNIIPNVTANSIKSASVEASPSVVQVNSSGGTNRSAIRALFIGQNNAPIKNVRVRFDLADDKNSVGGTFSTGSSVVYSDSNGEATSAYIPATRFSPTDGVTVRACYGYKDSDMVDGSGNKLCPNEAITTLTVVSSALSVGIGTNGLLIDNGLTYIQEFAVTVVDSAGQAKSDVQISPSIDLLRYGKGQWFYNRFLEEWYIDPVQYFEDVYGEYINSATGKLFDRGTPIYLEDPRSADQIALDPQGAPPIHANAACWNEDRNRNGVLEAEEDSRANGYSKTAGGNANGVLDPSRSDVSVRVHGASKTDTSGKAVVRIEYPKNMGSWVEYKILVSASGIGGTEGRSSWTDVLRVLAADVKSEATPAFAISRYGRTEGCDKAQ